MGGDVVVEPDGEVVGQGFERAAAGGGQELLEIIDTVVEPVDDGVHLGAQARGQDDRLGEVGPVPQASEGLGQLGLGHGHPLQHIERRLALLQPDDDHRHVMTPGPFW